MLIDNKRYWSAIKCMQQRIAVCGEYITSLDAATGDGDHWVNLNMGFGAVMEKKEEISALPLPDLFLAVAKVLMTSIGGSSGILYATAYMSAAKKIAGKNEITVAELADVVDAMAEGIMRRGKSAPGNKTMVDAIAPAAAAMREAVAAGKSDEEILEAMKQAAAEGAEKTKGMPALRGRAFYQADKGVGHLDPGAVTMSYQLAALADTLLGKQEATESDAVAKQRSGIVLDFDTADAAAWNEKGMTYFNAEFNKGRMCFSRALAIDPFNDRYYHNRGRKGLSLDRFQEALADFEMVMRLKPEDDDSRHYCGVAYFFMGKYEEAIEEFLESIRLMVKNNVPLIPPTVDWTWMAYMRLGEKEKAQQMLDTYIYPDMPCDDSDYDYLKRCLLYSGHTSPEKFMEELDNSDDVKSITETYALANYYRFVVGDIERCCEYLRQTLTYKTGHHAFAYKLATKDLQELA